MPLIKKMSRRENKDQTCSQDTTFNTIKISCLRITNKQKAVKLHITVRFCTNTTKVQ